VAGLIDGGQQRTALGVAQAVQVPLNTPRAHPPRQQSAHPTRLVIQPRASCRQAVEQLPAGAIRGGVCGEGGVDVHHRCAQPRHAAARTLRRVEDVHQPSLPQQAR